MNEVSAKEAAALYSLLEYRIFINRFSENDVFDFSGGKILLKEEVKKDYDAEGTFIHEFTHYIQHMTTTIGISISLQWLQIAYYFAKMCSEEDAISVPFCSKGKNSITFFEYFNNFFRQCDRLVGNKEEFLHGMDERISPFSIHQAGEKYYLVFPHNKNERFGVPLSGNIFIEGMAKAAKLMLRGAESFTKKDLGAWPTKREEMSLFYYDAILRFIKREFKDSNPLYGTTVISDACLMTRRPWEMFQISLEKAKKIITDGTDPCQWINLRDELAKTPLHVNGMDFIESELDSRLRDLSGANENEADFYVSHLLSLCKTAIVTRKREPHLFCPIKLDNNTLAKITNIIGCPPIMFSDSKEPILINHNDSLLKAHYLFSGFYWIIIGIIWGIVSHDGKTKGWRECPLLEGEWCSFTKADYCKKDFPNIQDANGKICHIGYAAHLLGVREKTFNCR